MIQPFPTINTVTKLVIYHKMIIVFLKLSKSSIYNGKQHERMGYLHISIIPNSGLPEISGVTQEQKNASQERQSLKTTSENQDSMKPERHEAGYWKNFKKPDDATLRKMLSPLQYKVTPKGRHGTAVQERIRQKQKGWYLCRYSLRRAALQLHR